MRNLDVSGINVFGSLVIGLIGGWLLMLPNEGKRIYKIPKIRNPG
jgi:hypothetical protein